MSTAAKSTSPATATTTTKEPKVANQKQEFDFSKMTPTEMVELAAKLQVQAQEGIQKEYESDISYIAKRTKSLGKTLTNYVSSILQLMDVEEKNALYTSLTRAAKGTPTPMKERAKRGSKPAREYVDKDSTGARPVTGSTYVLNGEEWVKGAKGASRKSFVDAVKHGAKWSELLKK